METNRRDSLPAPPPTPPSPTAATLPLPPPIASPKSPSSTSTTSTSSNAHSISKSDKLSQPKPQLQTNSENKSTTSLPWILHHILECELSSELPLRIMYSFNAGQKLPTLKEVHKWWAYDPKGKLIIEFLTSLPPTDAPPAEPAPIPEPTLQEDRREMRQDRLLDAGNEQLFDINKLIKSPTQDRRQSQGMPRGFISNFCLSKVFTASYNNVDFSQALTAIDYLRDLECTRRSALREAAQRLGIEKGNWRDVLAHDPVAKKWVEDAQVEEQITEGFYASLFMSLRIWVMVNDLQSEPYYKPNALAMLNTLFPPSIQELPNDRISVKALHKYRSTFYRYITSVGSKGTHVLDNLIVKLQQPGAKHSWSVTRFNLEEYIKCANSMIDEALLVDSIDFFRQRSFISHSRDSSRASSALSGRPRTGSSANSSFDGMHSIPATPRSPNFVSDTSSVRARNYEHRKLSAPSDAQEFFDPPPMPTPVQMPVPAEVPSPTSIKRPDSVVSSTRPSATQNGIPASPVSANTSTVPSERPESTNGSLSLIGEVRNSPGTIPDTAPSSPLGTVIPQNPKLPTKDLEFLSRPYHEMQAGAPPTLKKKLSASNFFLRKKTSAAKLVGKTESRDPYSFLASQSMEHFSRFSTTGESIMASVKERPQLRPKASWSDVKSAAATTRGRMESAGWAFTQQGNDTVGKKMRKGINLFAKRKGPEPAPLNIKDSPFLFVAPADDDDNISPQPTSGKTFHKMRLSPVFGPRSPIRLRKAASSSKLRRDPRVFTSSDIKEPFPTEFQSQAGKTEFQLSDFVNPRSVPAPAGKPIGDGTFVFPTTTPTISEIDERLKRSHMRQRAATMTRVDEREQSFHEGGR
ncbi:hypothetical protein PVAG01_08231 [Phlyctema vagabunda]|uniref:Meiotically up-regulated protein Msb1/Mug8 domain-containing protein n=1 Tax=Phlyctema vagabunda TaxID=108571 RepID=A0ABR4P8U2_9HELO